MPMPLDFSYYSVVMGVCQSDSVNNSMRLFNQILSLAPVPAFFVGFLFSINNPSAEICGSMSWEMPVMWILMSIAHVPPWIMWYQQRQYQKVKVFPEKQQ